VGELAASPYRDTICAVTAAVGALLWVKLFNMLALSGVLERVGAPGWREPKRRVPAPRGAPTGT
jgi:hypothetical protein